MNQTKRSNLYDSLIRIINTYSPEYIEQSEEAATYLNSLIDSIERFEDECNTDMVEKLDRDNWLNRQQA